MIAPMPSSALERAVTTSSGVFGAAMAPGQFWQLVANQSLWYSQGATPVASAGAGSVYLAAGSSAVISGRAGADVAVILDGSTAGKASLVRLEVY